MGDGKVLSLFSALKFIIHHPINKDHKTAALIRYAKWQIGSRLVTGPVIFPWIDGTKFIVRPGETGFTQNIYCGLHEFQDMAYILHVITPNDLFIDVGANVGSYTILACAARGARGYCFEPIPATYQKLLENLQINNLSARVKPFNIGISDKECDLLFTSDKNTMNHVIANEEKSSNAINVHVSTLDQVLADESPTVLKIDVEGFETKVINGAIHTLENRSLHSIIMETNKSNQRYGYEGEQLIHTIKSKGFQTYTYEPNQRKLNPYGDEEPRGNNSLFIRDANLVMERISKATIIGVYNCKL